MAEAEQTRRYPRQVTVEERPLFDRPWISNYAPLGVPTSVKTPALAANQLEMQGVMFRFIRDALTRCTPRDIGMLMTFGDGFYGLYAATQSRSPIDVFILESEHFEVPDRVEQTRLMAKVLKLAERVTIRKGEPPAESGRYGFGICVNVLPNLKDPRLALQELRNVVSGPLVLQSSISPTLVEPDYFFDQLVWRHWGCRFSHEWLVAAVVEAGWTVVNETIGPLPGSDPLDGASSYLLCV